MNAYIKNIAFFILLFSVTQASAQFGLRAKYNMNSFSDWDTYVDENVQGQTDEIFASNIEVGLDYWFRLKNHRIEFMPEAAMGLKTESTFANAGATTNFSYFAFNFNTQIYAFDLEGDCDCPTFSKQGPSLQKGFFFAVSPGLIYNTKEISIDNSDPAFSSNQVNLRIGVGAGFDIGVSDLFTISPSIMYNIAPGLNFDELSNIQGAPGEESITSGLNQIQIQVRFGFRPDYVKSYGRGRR